MKILFSPSSAAAFNLAAEEYLFSGSEDDFLFLYVNEPCVIIGSNQAVVNEVDMDFYIEHDIRIVRRLSGGGAVYHDKGNLNYCFIHNQRAGQSPLSGGFLLPVMDVLKSFQVPVQMWKRKDLWLPGGYKISGTASHVSRKRELHHGTLLYDADIEKLHRALTPENGRIHKRATASVPSPVKNIRTYLHENGLEYPPSDIFFDLFTKEMKKYYSITDLQMLENHDVEYVETLRKNKYSRREWNHKL